MRIVKDAAEFEWDKGNIGKNLKHNVEDNEAEEVFLDKRRFVFKDHLHSGNEERFRILGKTKKGRLLFIVFTKRDRKVRLISARDVNKKEVYLYEKKVGSTKV
ncbi:MAG: BrnT family toxin [Candidatus Daviesbacteria bacterium]|nr:BrnT family toxin [Candidatus Daviesbacteria bacterium]